MFNVATIQEEFLALIGYRPDDNPEIAFNPIGDLLGGSSGIVINGQHALLTIDNLVNLAPPFEEYTYPAWAIGTTYAKGTLVTDSGKYYASVQGTNVGHAVALTDWWRETNPFNEWLRNITLDAITQVVNDWINKKFERKTAANLLHRNWLFNYPGHEYQPIGTTGRFVALRVIACPYIDVLTRVDRLSLHMSGSENIPLKLFRNGGATPIETHTLDVGTATGLTGTFETSPEWELERNEVYYIAIDTEDLTTAELQNSIGNMDRVRWGDKYFPGVMPFAEVSGFHHEGPGEIGWDEVSPRITTGNNFGFNLILSSRCDYTEFLVDHKDLFPDLLAKGVAMALLRQFAYNPKAAVNRTEGNVNRASILYEIDGDSQGPRPGGIRYLYNQTMARSTFDSTKLSKFCLPCGNRGMKTGVI